MVAVAASTFALAAKDLYLADKYNFSTKDAKAMIEVCEKELPRSQSCEVVISVKVKENMND